MFFQGDTTIWPISPNLDFSQNLQGTTFNKDKNLHLFCIREKKLAYSDFEFFEIRSRVFLKFVFF
jgi:hypothetical protein